MQAPEKPAQEEPSKGALRLNSGVTTRRGSDPTQLLHPRSYHRKVVGGSGSGALAAQLLHAGPDRRKIVGCSMFDDALIEGMFANDFQLFDL
jgi:hypothetical protein